MYWGNNLPISIIMAVMPLNFKKDTKRTAATMTMQCDSLTHKQDY